jgi:hypothetical protein
MIVRRTFLDEASSRGKEVKLSKVVCGSLFRSGSDHVHGQQRGLL